MRLHYILTLAAGLLVVACGLSVRPSPPATPGAAQPPTQPIESPSPGSPPPTASPNPPAPVWTTYENIDLGYRVSLPEDWVVDEGGLSQPAQEVTLNPPQAEPFVSYVSISVDSRPLAEIRAGYASHTPQAVAADTDIAGVPAILFTYPDERVEAYFENAGRTYRLASDRWELGDVKAIFSSFAFLDRGVAEATAVALPPATVPASAGALLTPTASPTATAPLPTRPAATDTPLPTATQAPATADCSFTWFLNNPPSVCPEAAALESYAAAQRFEHGRMIWVEATDAFYILFDAGAHPSDARQAYRTVGPLALKPNASPDNRVGDAAPAGYFEPVSGFGLIWRNEVEGLDTDIRPALGWALEPEFGFTASFQCERQSTYSSRTCYLRDPAGQVVVLGWNALVGSVWSVRQ